jgi:hypothetical protein
MFLSRFCFAPMLSSKFHFDGDEERKEIPPLRRPAASQERSSKANAPPCSGRDDKCCRAEREQDFDGKCGAKATALLAGGSAAMRRLKQAAW